MPEPRHPKRWGSREGGADEPTDKGIEYSLGLAKDEKVVAHRLKQLLDAGCPLKFAEYIAATTEIDLHKAAETLQHALRGLNKEKDWEEINEKASLILEAFWPADKDLPIVSTKERNAPQKARERDEV